MFGIFDGIIAGGISRTNALKETEVKLKEKEIKLTAKDKAVQLKFERDEQLKVAEKIYKEHVNKSKEAKRIADQTFILHILYDSPVNKKIKEYYKKIWEKKLNEHKFISEESSIIFKKYEEEYNKFKQYSENLDKFIEEYDLYGEGLF
jgi:uncharacterized C2H2 Zn-finger protein